MTDIPEPDVLDCGCVFTYAIIAGVRTMTFSPCKPDCWVVAQVKAEAAEQGKPYCERPGP